MNYIFSDNGRTRVLCLSCKVKKKIKKNTKLSLQNVETSVVLIHLRSSRLNCYRVLISLNMKQVPEKKLYIGQWPYITKYIQSIQFNCSKRTKGG